MTQFLGTMIIPRLASAPSSPTDGQLYWNTTDDFIYVYDSDDAVWRVPGAGTGEAAFVPRGQLPKFGRVEFYGHSISRVGASDGRKTTPQRVGAVLGAEVIDYTLAGQCQARSQGGWGLSGGTWLGDGGWAYQYRRMDPGEPQGTDATHGSQQLFEGRRNLVIFNTGYNDIAAGTISGGTATNAADLLPFERALTACISRARATRVWDTSSSVFSYGGSPSTVASSAEPAANGTLPNSKMWTAAQDPAVTLTLPSTFPGGTVALAFLCNNSGDGGTWAVKVDGGAYGSNFVMEDVQSTSTGVLGTGWCTGIIRCTGLSAGSHTIVAKVVSAPTSKAYFDSAWHESLEPPLIGVCKQYLVDAAAGGHTSTAIGYLNTCIDNAVGVFADTDTVFSIDLSAANYVSGTDNPLYDIHPNDKGHGIIANAILEAVWSKSRTMLTNSKANGDGIGISRLPATMDDNVIQPANDVASALILKENPAGTSNSDLMKWQNRAGTNFGVINKSGGLELDSQAAGTQAAGLKIGGAYITDGGAYLLNYLNITTDQASFSDKIAVTNNAYFGGAVVIGSDTSLSRTSANVLTLASGDTLAITSDQTIGGTLTFGGDASLSRTAADTLSLGAGDTLVVDGAAGGTAGLTIGTATIKALGVYFPDYLTVTSTQVGFSGIVTVGSSLYIGASTATDTILTRAAANRAEMASGDTISNPTGTFGTVYSSAQSIATAPGSAAWSAANASYYIRIFIPNRTTITGISYVVGGTSNGNVKVGLYDNASPMNQLVLSASTAQSAANNVQNVAFTSTYDAHPGIYYIFISGSSATGTAQMAKHFQFQQTGTTEFTTPPSTKTRPTTWLNTNCPIVATY